MKTYLSLVMISALLTLSACSGVESEAKYPTGADRASTGGDIYAESPSIFGKGGLSILGGKDKEGDGSGVVVNTYLWRAALDTFSFTPLASADPFGGTIITDWYSAPDTPNERTKLLERVWKGSLVAGVSSVWLIAVGRMRSWSPAAW